MKSFVTGALGQLGQELRTLLPTDTVWTDLAANPDLNVEPLDITDAIAVMAAVEAAQPSVIYHCAAYTNVDGAESNQALARAVNVDGTVNVARAAATVGAKLVVLSTDFVFDGTSNAPYRETDQPNPSSVYGQTKLDAERVAQATCQHTFIVRTAWLYGPSVPVAPVKNFPQTMQRLANERAEITVVNDQTGSPTFTKDLATAILKLAATDGYGVWHITNQGQASWYEFACAILADKIEADAVTVKPISTVEYPTAAKRPAYSVLDTGKFVSRFGPLRFWHAALAGYLLNHH